MQKPESKSTHSASCLPSMARASFAQWIKTMGPPSALLTLALTMAQVALASPKPQSKQTRPVVTLVYPLNGKGDAAFNDSAAEAKPTVKRLFDIEVGEIQPKNQEDLTNQIEKAAAGGASLIIGIGTRLEGPISAAAKRYPKVHFGLIDVASKGANISSVVFKEQEAGYLAGYVAARKSATKHIGFIGGMPIPPIERFLAGYRQGAQASYPKHKLKLDYLGNAVDEVFNNPAKAKQVARQQYAAGVDVIFAVAGASNPGIFEAAAETERFAVGVDRNQNDMEPGHILTSLVKRIDLAVISLIEAEFKNKFKAGTRWIGVKEGAIELAIDHNSNKLLSERLRKDVEKIRQKIIQGSVKVSMN